MLKLIYAEFQQIYADIKPLLECQRLLAELFLRAI